MRTIVANFKIMKKLMIILGCFSENRVDADNKKNESIIFKNILKRRFSLNLSTSSKDKKI